MNLENVNKILIIRLSSLGDILLTTPLIRTLKNKFPQLKIDFLLREEYADALKYNPHLNKQFYLKLNQNYDEIQQLLKNNEYDFIIDLQNNFRSRNITSACEKKIYKYRKKNFQKFLLVHFKLNSKKKYLSVPEKYARALPEFELDEKGLEIFLPVNIETQLTGGEKYIGICPGSRHFTKMYPKEYFVELCKMICSAGLLPVLLGGADDVEVCEFIAKQVPEVINLAAGDDLLTIAAHMKKCEVIVCNDSGLMHLASAVGAPLIAIFGSTVKEFGFAPYKSKNLILENNSLTCRPCSHIGQSDCPKKHFECMINITPEFVFSQLDNLIKKV